MFVSIVCNKQRKTMPALHSEQSRSTRLPAHREDWNTFSFGWSTLRSIWNHCNTIHNQRLHVIHFQSQRFPRDNPRHRVFNRSMKATILSFTHSTATTKKKQRICEAMLFWERRDFQRGRMRLFQNEIEIVGNEIRPIQTALEWMANDLMRVCVHTWN